MWTRGMNGRVKFVTGRNIGERREEEKAENK